MQTCVVRKTNETLDPEVHNHPRFSLIFGTTDDQGLRLSSIAKVNASLFQAYGLLRASGTGPNEALSTIAMGSAAKFLGVNQLASKKYARNDSSRGLTCLVRGSTFLQNVWGSDVKEGDTLLLILVKRRMFRHATFFIGDGARVDLQWEPTLRDFEECPQYVAVRTPNGELPKGVLVYDVINIGLCTQVGNVHASKRGRWANSINPPEIITLDGGTPLGAPIQAHISI